LSVVKILSAGMKAVRPGVDAVRTAAAQYDDTGHVAILPGAPAATRRLRELLGAPAPAPDEDALVILAATPGTDLSAGVAALERARARHPSSAIAILIGSERERAELERGLLEGHRLEPSNLIHVASLEGAGADAVLDRVVDALGDGAPDVARRNPALRPAVARRIVQKAARRAGAVGAVPLAGADMGVLALLQVKMVAQLAALHDRPFGAERALEAVAIVGAGFGLRAIGRSAAGLVPGAGWAVRGGLSYAATRALGDAAAARLAAGHDLIEGRWLDAVKPKVQGVLDRLRGGS
jgi:uncharacterized protein (DUF697 family)